ncbi:MAG: ATP synthase F1 subunit epsilon [Chloroflexi bacterium]|nr:ATP synthase F1 subunit epsilon [Chloroflexota bacterium]MDA1146568.1 ATP synthase F1 subunit epsilon [Chloroflexota bacterium]MQC82742.1 ATP synthase F1 subunit epsilon [Chloroflexota bacterium]PKB56766.1 MAG: ATP synthase F1 subunit epsilon [SAR202 cluster bacterium Casp-Chloro-G1]
MPLTLSIVTADRTVLERDDVTRLVVPGSDGQLTILPSHAALMVGLGLGEMLAYTPSGVEPIAIHGGFLQVAHDEVTVLADAAEHADDINEDRADEARKRAETRLAGRTQELGEGQFDLLRAQLSVQRALLRMKVRRRKHGSGAPTVRSN